MADAADSKSAEVNPHVGSSPTSGTTHLQTRLVKDLNFSPMRRLQTLLAVFLVSTAAFAVEPTLRQPGRDIEGLRHMIVHASKPLTPEDRQELAAKGVLVQRAMTNGRYLARVAEGRTVADARVTSIEPLTVEKKISRTALRETGRGKTWAELNVYFHDDVKFDDARAALLAAGAAMDPLSLDFLAPRRIVVKIAPESLEALAADDRVQAVTGPMRFKIKSDNAKSAAMSHVTELFSAPYDLSGAGVNVSLFELGTAQADHVEFGGRLTVQPQVVGGSNSNKNHATHVAGTIGASGVNALAKGMAPKAKVFQFCVRSGGNSCTNDFLSDKDKELSKVGSRVDNNSWGYVLGWDLDEYYVWNDGEEFWGAYELELVSPIDAISLERNILFVHSAGNDGDAPGFAAFSEHRHVDDDFDVIKDKLFCYSINGSGTDCPTAICNGTDSAGKYAGCEIKKHHPSIPFDTIGMVSSGKNTIAVGAVQENAAAINIADFSSRGPAKDGRVKPDVVARGAGVISTVPTNTYGTSNGTSMAAPAVTGISALLIEQWRKVFVSDPNPVQLKALIIAGADDLGNPGPDYTYGFGLVNAKNSADLIIGDAGSGKRIRNISVGNGQETQIPIVLDAAQNLRVVLQWGDPSIPLVNEFVADKALVNDLDMKIVGPTGTVHLPYVLDKANFNANATTGVNTVDNTEQIEIKNAAPGVYRVSVNGRNVPQGPQNAVVISTARTAAPCLDLTESSNDGGYGPIVTGQTIHAALCSSSDRDIFRFVAMPGDVRVTFTTGDTAISATLINETTKATSTVSIPANSTHTFSERATGGETTFTVEVQSLGTLGAEPFYRFTPQFIAPSAPRRRSVR